jgi:hypothetical protein
VPVVAKHLPVPKQADLRARSLAKQRPYVDTVSDVLAHRGADAPRAALAAEVGLACCHAIQRVTGDPLPC